MGIRGFFGIDPIQRSNVVRLMLEFSDAIKRQSVSRCGPSNTWAVFPSSLGETPSFFHPMNGVASNAAGGGRAGGELLGCRFQEHAVATVGGPARCQKLRRTDLRRGGWHPDAFLREGTSQA